MSTFAENGAVGLSGSDGKASLYVMQFEEAAQGAADLQAAQVEVVHLFATFPGMALVRLTPEQAGVWQRHANVVSVEADGQVSVRWLGRGGQEGDAEASSSSSTASGASTSNASTSNASTSNASTSNASTSNASTSSASTSSASGVGQGNGYLPDPYGTAPGMQLIRAAEVQEKGYFGAGARIAMLDTGVNVKSQRVQVAGGVSFVEDEPDFDDQQGHGTAMAGIIGLQPAVGAADCSVGVAPHVELWAVKVLNRFGLGTISAVLQGLEWSILQKADIVTMCFGTLVHSAALKAALDIAYAHGLLMVAPTGNIGAADGVDVPARYRAVIAVGAVDARGVLAPFSNQGPEVELVAPGVSIPGLFLQDLPLVQSGTSLAAAYVAGAAALFKAGASELSNHALRERLVKSAEARGEREQYGYGLVNVSRALQLEAVASDVAEGVKNDPPTVIAASLPDQNAQGKTPSQAQLLEVGTHYRSTLQSADDVNLYRIDLQANDVIEVELSYLPNGATYSMVLYDANGTPVGDAVSLSGSLQIATLEVTVAGAYLIKVFSGGAFETEHPYTLYVDRYASLSGRISESRTLTAEAGPYKICGGGLTFAAGVVLDVEPGTVFNVRSRDPIRLQENATFNLLGTADHPIIVLGAQGNSGGALWDGLVCEAESATINHQYVTVQYDTFLQPQMSPLLQMEAPDLPPSQRAEASKRWYQAVSPYHFSMWDPFTLHMQDLYFGMDVEIFSAWEIESNRLSDERYERGEVNYWEFVNAHFMRDIAEAERLVATGETASHYRVQRLVDYRKQGGIWLSEHGLIKLTNVLNLLRGDASEQFYRHLLAMTVSFWLSHNTAIIYWDKRAREREIWQKEDLYESHFINGVIIRLDYSSDMPYSLPPFGHYTPPIGIIGFLLHHGPFRYPDQYPAPVPPPAPEGTLDYEDETTLQLVKTYVEYMLKNGTSSVFTWWLPTPSDREIFAVKQQPSIALLATPSDWKREVLDPTWKTVEALEAKYLQDDSSDLQPVRQDAVTTG